MNPVIVTCRDDIIRYCKKNGINFREFNQEVIIPDTVKDCTMMFFGCWGFNQKVIIPNGVINCNNMFWECRSFNQEVIISALKKLEGD